MRVLHLIRRPNDTTAAEIIAEQKRLAEVTVVYLHDAVASPLGVGAREYVREEDCLARGVRPQVEPISDERLISLLFEHDRVITW